MLNQSFVKLLIFLFSPEDTSSIRLSKRREYILKTNALKMTNRPNIVEKPNASFA